MAKRTRKQAIIGAGILIGISATSIATGFVSKHIIDQNKINALQAKANGNLLDPLDPKTPIGDYNVATKNMFYDTQYLNFHMGHAGIGQTLTPWGWLGTYESSGNKSGYDGGTLALTGWNGQVLWLATNKSGEVIDSNKQYDVNENSQNASPKYEKYDEIYDAKYDHNNNWILVVRYSASSDNGNNKKNGLKGMTLQVLDAKTGKELCAPVAIPNGMRTTGDESNSNWNNLPRNYYKRYQNYVKISDNKLLWGFFTNVNKMKSSFGRAGVPPYEYFWYQDSTSNKIRSAFMDFFVIEKHNNGTVSIKPLSYISEIENDNNWGEGFDNRFALYSSPIMINANATIKISFLSTNNDDDNVESDLTKISQKRIVLELNEGSSSIKAKTIENGIELYDKNNESDSLIKFNNIINKASTKMFIENKKGDQKFDYFVTHPVQNILGLNNYSIPILYAAKEDRSVYSVLNVVLDENGNYVTTKSKYFSPGYDADEYVQKNNIYDKPNEEIVKMGKIDFNLFPSSSDGIANNDVNNAFIYGPFAISPFDGTIIFSARPNFIKTKDNKDEFTDKTLNFASLSIASPTAGKLIGGNSVHNNYATFVLMNETSKKNDLTIGNMLHIAKNLTFDLYGTYDYQWIESNKTPKVKLYFNADGNKKNEFTSMNEASGETLKTNAIGIIEPKHYVYSYQQKTNRWMEAITSNTNTSANENQQESIYAIEDNKNLYAYVSSIADPTKWYSRTWTNFNTPENSLINGYEIINDDLLNRTKIDRLDGNSIANEQIKKSNKMLDALSNYFNTNEELRKQIPFWRPKIVVDDDKQVEGQNTDNKITLKYSYDFLANNASSYSTIKKSDIGFSKFASNNIDDLFSNKYEKKYEITNVSTLLTKELGNGVKISNINGKFGSDDLSISTIDIGVSDSQIGDKYGINNNDRSDLLQVEYGIVFNENDENGEQNSNKLWTNAANNNNFNGTYKINEFKTKLKEFIEWKINNLEWDHENSKGVYGMNNLTIRSYLKFDPTKVGGQIWDISDLIGTTSEQKQKTYAAYVGDKLYIYKDEKYGNDDHLIFQQNSEKFEENHGNYGFKQSIKQKMYDSSVVFPNDNKLIKSPGWESVKHSLRRLVNEQNFFENVSVDLLRNEVVLTFINDKFANIFKNINQMFNVGISLFVNIYNLNDELTLWYNSYNVFDIGKKIYIPANIAYTDSGWKSNIKGKKIKFSIADFSKNASSAVPNVENINISELFKTQQIKNIGFYILPMTKVVKELNNNTTLLGETINQRNIFFDDTNVSNTIESSWSWYRISELRSNFSLTPKITYNNGVIDTGIKQNNFKTFQWNNSTTLDFTYNETNNEDQYKDMFDRQFSIVQKTPNIDDLNSVAIGNEQEFVTNYNPYTIDGKTWYKGSEIEAHLDSIKDDDQYNKFPKEFAILTRIVYVGNGNDNDYDWDKKVEFIFGNFFDSSKGQAKVNKSATSWVDTNKKPFSYVTKISDFTNEFELVESQDIAGTKLKLKKNSNIANDWEKITSSGFKIAFISHNSNISAGSKAKVAQKDDFIDLNNAKDKLLSDGVDVTFNNNQFGYVWIYSDQTNIDSDNYPSLNSQPVRYRQLQVEKMNDDQLRYLAFEKENEKTQIGVLSNPMETKKVTIEVDYAWIRDTKFADGKTIHTLAKEDIENFEKEIIKKIKSPYKDQVKLNFELKNSENNDTKSNLNVDSLFNEISRLRQEYTNEYLGLMRLNKSSQSNTKYFNYEIKAKFIMTNGMFPTFVDNDEPNKEDERVNTDNIVTDINLEKYVNFLKAQKLAVEGSANSVEKITITNTNWDNSTFLGDKSFEQIIDGLKFFGVGIEFKAMGIDGAQWGELSSITSFNENVGKILMRFSLASNLNVKLLLPDNEISSPNTGVSHSSDIELDLQVTLKVQVSQEFIETFKNSNPFSGNTKNLIIDQEKENTLTSSILNENKANNDAFEKLQLEVQYQLKEMTEWKNRNDLISYLTSETRDWKSNEIKIKIVIKNSGNEFAIENNEYVILNQDISASAKVKLYINQLNLEDLAAKVKISGETNNLNWIWPSGLELENGTNDVKNKQGLKLQFTTKEIQQKPNNPNTNDQPESGWSNSIPNSVDPVKRYVAIAYVASDGYVLWDDVQIHQVKFDKLITKINVDPNWLDSLVFEGTNTLSVEKLKNKENEVKDKINEPNLKQHVDIQYQLIVSNNNSNWLDANELKKLIENYVSDYSNATSGILKFGTNKVASDINDYAKINAKFVSNNDNYEVYDQINNSNDVVKENVNVAIKTKIDLSTYYQILTTTKTVFDPGSSSSNVKGFTPPSMNGEIDKTFLGGLTFDQIAEILNKVGIVIEFQSPNNGEQDSTQWKTKNDIKKLSHLNELKMRFRIENNTESNWANSYEIYVKDSNTKEDVNSPTEINLIANLKKTINVDPANDLVGYVIDGTTVKLSDLHLNDIIKKEQEIIEKVKKNNISGSNTIENVDLKIAYQLKGKEEWFVGIREFDNGLINFGKEKFNFNSNQVSAKFYLEPNNDEYVLSNTNSNIIHAEEFSDTTTFAIFVHSGEYEKNTSSLKAIGSSDNFKIEGLNLWKATVPNGLSLQWSNLESPKNDEDSNNVQEWTDNIPKTLNSHKKLWLRFKEKPGYFYEDRKAGRPWSDKIYEINTSDITVQLKLKSNWLNQITLIGDNLVEITNIDEAQVIKLATDANQNPNQMLIIEYTFDDKNWYTKEEFIQELTKSKGKRNDEYFFIKREDIKARFAIDPEKNKDKTYSLNIDNETITNENRNKFNKELITQNLNTSVKGYINLDFLSDFENTTFQIKGTTSQPRLVIDNNKRNELDKLLNVYSSNSIFNILFTTTKNNGGNGDKPDFSNIDQKIWKPNSGLIQENELGISIPATKYFAIGFLLDANKVNEYEIHKEGNDYTNEGYSFDVDVQITIEIENPFTSQQKNIEIIFNDINTNNAKFYQGQGGFGLIAKGTKDWADNVIQSSKLTDEEKNALELIYYVSDVALTQEQIDNITSANEIQNYGSNAKWKAVSGNDYINSNLKVGNYVLAALRVKKELYEKENGFVLKNDDFSPTTPTRAYGYLVKVSDLKLNEDLIEYQNTLNSWQEPLDGYSTIKNVSLKPDGNGNYLGVDIKLNLFNKFHLDKEDKIIEINNQRLVVRDPNGATSKGNYKGNDGRDIVDKNGHTIPILVNNETNNLAKPLKEKDSTRDVMLTQITEGSFAYMENKPEFNLFRNQDIQFEYVAKVGSDSNKPDFILDDTNKNKVDHVIGNKIKFAIENKDNVKYEFDKSILSELKYENATNASSKPINGGSKLVTPIKAEITNKDGITTKLVGKEIVESVQSTFNGKVKVQYTIIKGEDGQTSRYDGIDVSNYTTLKNGDKIKVEMVAITDDYIFAQAPEPLIITVSGLLEQSPEKSQLEFLRVEQGGTINGQGSFKVLVNNPENDDTNNEESILAGYKFVIRVWDSQRKVKIDWTDNQQKLVNLSNGDKVEWKLVTAKGNPTTDQYYNTVSDGTEIRGDANIVYKFKQIQAKGNNAVQTVSNSIGEVPTNDQQYPTNSGFIIDGLSEHVDVEKLNENQFNYLMNELNWTWKGLNTQGYIYTNKNINSLEVPSAYVQNPLMKNQLDLSTKINVNLVNLFEKGIISFWNATKEVGFNYSPDALSNNLTNGDSIKAHYFDGQNQYEFDLGNVNGLANISDQMNPLWWVLIGAGSIITLGGLAIFYFISRNRKLKK